MPESQGMWRSLVEKREMKLENVDMPRENAAQELRASRGRNPCTYALICSDEHFHIRRWARIEWKIRDTSGEWHLLCAKRSHTSSAQTAGSQLLPDSGQHWKLRC